MNEQTAAGQFDVIIIGAGAAGLMCAIEAGKRGRRVLVVDHANRAGKKILMSGGGRCNFTNLDVTPDKFISKNPHFCKSALSRHTQWDFIALVEKHQINYHEKTLGQLFCDQKSSMIVNMLLDECQQYQVNIRLNTTVNTIDKLGDSTYILYTDLGWLPCSSLVIATGGLSIPTMGASAFGYHIAEQFGLTVLPTRAGLVPLTHHEADKIQYSPLSGIAVTSTVTAELAEFDENILFTHRGLSGPAILQISSYWQPGEKIKLNLLPQIDLTQLIGGAPPEKTLKAVLSAYLPKRLIDIKLGADLPSQLIKQLTPHTLQAIIQSLQNWRVTPNGTEGYRTAEVTLGGVDTDQISSKTMEAKSHPGLYFIGEVLDVTGWLGGYNFQWAWSSGWAAGQVV